MVASLMDEIDDRMLWHGGNHVGESKFNRVVGRVLAKLRGTDDYNPTRTAQHTGLDRSFLYAVEGGDKGISLFSLFRIASASKISASEFVAKIEAELNAEAERTEP